MAGDYKVVLDEMVSSMDLPVEEAGATFESVLKRPKSRAASKRNLRRAVVA
jgi:hypothetical protein